MVTRDMKVSQVLKKYPQLLHVLTSFHPHFKRLDNPIMRRFLAPRVTIGDAAKIAGVKAEALLNELNRALGVEVPSLEVEAQEEVAAQPLPPESEDRVELDVRDDLRSGSDPFKKIMAAVKGLKEGQVLIIRNIFEPVPLYQVLGRQGFAHFTERLGEEDWRVYFYKGEVSSFEGEGEVPGGKVRTIDCRGLTPPEPFMRALTALEGLGEGEVLIMLNDRPPALLYPELEARGFTHKTEQAPEGHYIITIERLGGTL